ncbi:fibronectin type III domain-containing protein [Candidatus Poriferisodalis sp.]|uniref:fibronectin type III domain-containing protein n=1 Tax=Candidatus Poriferisodalis sp. TaxID=3101277 RepID=UPI003C6F0BE0
MVNPPWPLVERRKPTHAGARTDVSTRACRGTGRRRFAVALVLALVAAMLTAPGAHGTTPLTALFEDVPTSHDGTEFSLTLKFTVEPLLSYETLRDDALLVAGGTVASASRVAAGHDDRWNITIAPSVDDNGDPTGENVIVTLRVTASCEDLGAICTSDDQPLTNADEIEARIPGPDSANDPPPAVTVPASPTGLSDDSVSHDSVTLSWDDPVDSSITGYQVLRRNRDGDDYGDGSGAPEFEVVVDDTGSADASYTDTQTSPSTRYVYRVKARNAQGLSDQSGYLNVDTPAQPDDAPVDSGATEDSDDSGGSEETKETGDSGDDSSTAETGAPQRSARGPRSTITPKTGVTPRQNSDDCSSGTGTSCTIAIGTPKSGSIETAGDVDVFKMRLATNTMYTATVDGGSGDAKLGSTAQLKWHHPNLELIVLSPAATTVDINTAYALNPGSSGSLDTTEGSPTRYKRVITIYVEVGGSGGATGTYTVTVAPKADDCRAGTNTTCAFEEAGGAVGYTNIERPVFRAEGNIERSQDVDWYRTPTLLVGNEYVIAVTSEVFGDNTQAHAVKDPQIVGLYTGSGTKIPFTANRDQGLRRAGIGYVDYFRRLSLNRQGEIDQASAEHIRPLQPHYPNGAFVDAVMTLTPGRSREYFVGVGSELALTGSYAVNLYRVSRTQLFTDPQQYSVRGSGNLGSRQDEPNTPGDTTSFVFYDPGFSGASVGGVIQTWKSREYREAGFGDRLGIGAENDHDWFDTYLRSGRRYEITLESREIFDQIISRNPRVHRSFPSGLQLMGVVRDNGLSIVPGTQVPFTKRLEFTVPTTGDYYIVVAGITNLYNINLSGHSSEYRATDMFKGHKLSLEGGHYQLSIKRLS